MIALFPGAFVLSSLLSYHGLRKGSLDRSGALAAFAVGYLSLANSLKFFGILMLSFYFAGSRATKIKADVKSRLEEGHAPPHDKARHQLAGNRNAFQVLCNSAVGTASSVIYRIIAPSPGDCGLSNSYQRALVVAALSFYAACMGDTLASELGMLANSKPVMITTGAETAPGTNGAVTYWGTFCSAAGGFFIGVVAVIDLLAESQLCGMNILAVLSLASLSGLLGSCIDSILGATLQETLWSPGQKRVVKSMQPDAVNIGSRKASLTNDQVNFLASLAAVSITVALDILAQS